VPLPFSYFQKLNKNQMNPLEFLFALIENYVPITPGRFTAIKSQATSWYEDKNTAETNRIAAWVKGQGDKWGVQLCLAVLFIFAMRWIHDFMNPKTEGQTKM
jgi:hypothetical protein